MRYGYVWAEDAASGRPARKDRPCLIVDVTTTAGRTVVSVCPISHSAPRIPDAVGELDDARVRRRAGLDDVPQRVIGSEVNEFDWPAPELVPSVLGDPQLGVMADRVAGAVRRTLADRIDAGELAVVVRPRA